MAQLRPSFLNALGVATKGLVLALVLSHASGVPAQSRVDWPALSAPQRSALAPLERDWGSIPPGQQQKWIEVANRYDKLPPADRARLTQRMTEWSRLSVQDRARARLNFQEARQVSPEERKQQWQSYRALPADERRAFAARAQPAATAPQRSGADTRSSVKSNLVRVSPPAPAQPVSATVVHRGAGATTNLVSKPATPPLHQQAGLPKLAATPGFVDEATLLPQRGAQGAAVRAKPPEAAKKPSP